ncbi:MAG: DUF4143 domain-containing protein [Methanobrevibacter sp.]|jgi:predicted AAA+ superfamily ATPase|nr:DUF4143 domain-containing protein [Methanobrevibacter sp.]
MSFQEYLYFKHNIRIKTDLSNLIKTLILTGDVETVKTKERELNDQLPPLRTPLKKELELYLKRGGFPYGFGLNEFEFVTITQEMGERIVENDVSHYQTLRNGSKETIYKLITFLALQNPGELSVNNLSQKIYASMSVIHNLLNILEKTHLIFAVNSYGGASKAVKKPKKYYFLSPSIKSSLTKYLSSYGTDHQKFLGTLAETFVGSCFFRLQESYELSTRIFYPTEKGGVDFLLTTPDEKIIPIEVGIGKKDKKQLKKAINKYNCDYGIIISNETPLIRKEEDIIYLPLTSFSLLN